MLTTKRFKFNFKGYETMRTKLENVIYIAWVTALGLFSGTVYAISLDDVSFASLPGERIQIKLMLSEALPAEPLSFTIDSPARIAVDFPNTSLNLAEKSQIIGIGVANSLSAVEAAGRTRVVINLTRAVSYTMEVEGNSVVLNLTGGDIASSVSSSGSIENIDFRRGDKGEGRIIVKLSDPLIPINMDSREGKVVINFLDVQLPSNLDRKLDVVDFATPVKEIDTAANGNNVKMSISAVSKDYDYLAYQSEDHYIIEFKPLTKAEEEQKEDKFDGKKLSLNFQDIEVRAILQLFTEFTEKNMVVSDDVSGKMTLRLKNVPWDQALDIILKSRGLGMREIGNVIMVAPAEELVARERLKLEANRQIEELSPLRTEFIQINYANAADLMVLIQMEGDSLLSERGNVSIDKRTNTLVIQDISSSLESIRGLILKLDIPVRQVLIESRIVNADESFAKHMGVRFGHSKHTTQGGATREAVGDGSEGDSFVAIGGGQAGSVNYGGATTFNTGGNENYIVDLPATAKGAPALALAIGEVGSYLWQLELSALIAEGRGENIASPRVITSNQHEAVMEAGVQIPYREASSSGAATTSFKDAVLRLRVTPQITPDDNIIMDLEVHQDAVGTVFGGGVPSINTRSVTTQVLVKDGETVVLGGIFTSVDNKTVAKVPFFGDIPYLGFLFKRTGNKKTKNELLIFITPKILKDGLTI